MRVISTQPIVVQTGVVREYRRGDRPKAIQEKYHISAATLYRILRNGEVPLRRRNRKVTDKVKDAVVLDYLRGDKTTIIALEHEIGPGPVYRILKERGVKLSRGQGRAAGNPPDEPAAEPVPATEPTPEPVTEPAVDAAGLYCEPCDQSFSTAPGKASHERSLAHRVKVADGREGGFLTAISALVDEDVPHDVTRRRLDNLLEAHFAKASEATLKDIGLWEKAIGEGIEPAEIVKAAVETFIALCCRALPGAEELDDGSFRIRPTEEGSDGN